MIKRAVLNCVWRAGYTLMKNSDVRTFEQRRPVADTKKTEDVDEWVAANKTEVDTRSREFDEWVSAKEKEIATRTRELNDWVSAKEADTLAKNRWAAEKERELASRLSELDQSARQPFVTVRYPGPTGPQIAVCASPNSAKAFAQQLSAVSNSLGGSRLLDAVRYAMLDEVYLSAFAFYEWIYRPGPDACAIVVAINAGGSHAPIFCGYPIIDLCRVQQRTPEDRAHDLASLLTSLADANGHDPRYWLMHSLAFALSRHFGQTGKYDKGLAFVELAMNLPVPERYGHLAACRHVLDLKQQGLPVPPRLEKFGGPDNHFLSERTCTHPYKRFDINPTGEVLICCSMWAPLSYGNIVKEDTSAVLNSGNAQKMRRSMIDGTFRYCNHLHCAVMVRDMLPKKSDPETIDDPVMRAALDNNEMQVASAQNVTFALDYTCNLSCPSCRTERMVQRETEHAAERAALDKKLRNLLHGAKTLYMNPAGEFLASRPSRALLQSIDPATNPDLRIDIISNGTLFSELQWNKFSNAHALVRNVRISADAATAPTFEMIRRGGKWAPFLANIEYIGRLRKQGQIKEFILAFTYQVGNFREMKAFVELSERIGACAASFERLAKTIAMTHAEYDDRAVHLPGHPLYVEFIEIISDESFNKPNVHHDFGFHAREPLSRTGGPRHQVSHV